MSIVDSPCMVWQGGRNADGYGRVCIGGSKVLLAHRVAYADYHMLPLDSIKGKVIRHVCDNPPCFNPLHLTAGTQTANMDDMHRRQREYRIVPREAVPWIRTHYIPRHPEFGQTAMAKRFGVTKHAIHAIIKGKNNVRDNQ